MKKNFLTVIALLAVFTLVLTGCGSKEAAETQGPAATAAPAETQAAAPVALGLADFSLSTATWSSPNGATVTLTAVPGTYTEGQTAAFIVRLEGEEVANVPCTWDGTRYTADAELNAADGLCYYVLMTGPDGNHAEVAVNTPSAPTDEALINLATSLTSYCTLTVDGSTCADGKLTVTAGTAQVQTPVITNLGETITVSEAVLTLSHNGQSIATQSLTLTAAESAGLYRLALSDLTFDIPELENDEQLELYLDVTLSNGQLLRTAGGSFQYNDGQLLTTVG